VKIGRYLKSRSLIAASLILIVLMVNGCAADSNSPTSPSSSSSAQGGFYIIGDVNFSVDIPVIVSTSQLDSTSMVGTSVLRLEDGGYRMYLQSRDRDNNVDIVSLFSSDGLSWLVDPGIRIQHGSEEDFDTEAGEPDAYIGLDGKYYMAYTGRQPDASAPSSALLHKIVFAVSDDSLAWTKLDITYSDSYNINDFASSADVIRIGDGFVMYYTGGKNIISATSTDGLNWERGSELFSIGHDSTTVYLNGFYYLFFKAPANLLYTVLDEVDALLMAISTDGINWFSGIYRVVVTRDDGTELSNSDLDDPAAMILDDGSLRLYLNSNGGQDIFSIKPVSALPEPS
jgi:predicted GH43/DUF377 family glycosyl hydrolase